MNERETCYCTIHGILTAILTPKITPSAQNRDLLLGRSWIDLYTIFQLLGHSDIKMTQRYAHLTPNHKKIAVNMIHFTEDAKNKQERELKVDYSAN